MKPLALFLLLSCVNFSFAQEETEHVISSAVFGTERKISVRLPAGYSKDSSQVYPVAYIFDGQFQGYRSVVYGINEYYSQTDHTIPFIVVSVHTEDRWEEFIPLEKTDLSGKKTYSTKLSDHLNNEIFPFVKDNYRITGFRLGIGHSLGATFLLYETFRDNSAFDAVIAASPNTSQNNLSELVPQFIKEHPDMNKFIYIANGDTGAMEKMFLQSTLEMNTAVTSLQSGFPDWNFRKLVNTDHMATFPATISEGYLLLSEKWHISANDINAFRGKQDKFLEDEIRKCLKRKSDFRKKPVVYSAENLRIMESIVSRAGEDEIELDINNLTYKELKTDTMSAEKKALLLEDLDYDRPIILYEYVYRNAEKALNQGNYELAASEFLCAFDMGFMQGTYAERMSSLSAFAQTGNIEEAFRQLDLLANRFEYRGSKEFTGNKLLKPLHKDKRWNELMAKFDENKRKADEERAKAQ